jgi:lysophospholipase L1-like esterase
MRGARLRALCLAAALGACGGEPALTPVPTGATIVAFGDSLTRGTGAGRDESYPAVLAALSGRAVINAGVPGELSAQGLERLAGVLDAHDPELLILCHAGNDILRKKDPDRAAANLIAMIELARARDIQVVLLAVPRPGLLLGTAEFYDQVAAATGVLLERDIFASVLGKPALKADAVHPNAAGYRRVAERLYAFLDEAGAF